MPRPNSNRATCWASALTFSLVSACSAGSTPALPARVILITCDTLRADRLGAYGYERDVSPSLDALASESVLFERAYSSAASTVPSVSSLLSGRLPDEIGVSGGNQTLMHPSVESLAEVAGKAGLIPGAVVSNWVLRVQPGHATAGVSQGFVFFDDKMDQLESDRAVAERRASGTTAVALAWLRERKQLGEESFFLWVHYQDPHGPYTPKDEFLESFEREAAEVSSEQLLPIKLGTNTSGRGQIPDYQIIDGEARAFPYLDRYDAEIRTFDEALGELLKELRDLEWFDSSLLVFTSDHGESLGEDDYWFCHGQSLADEVVRVPLIVRFPGASSELQPARRTDIASHLDIYPTVLEHLGLASSSSGSSLGSSLRAALPAERELFQNCGELGSRRRHKALISGAWRVVRPAGKAAPSLFNLNDELTPELNVAEENTERLREMLDRLEELEAAILPERDVIKRKANRRDEEMLRALGYAGDDEREQ